MENEKLPIKFFAPREVDELRIEGNKNPEKPKWVLQGEELKQRLLCWHGFWITDNSCSMHTRSESRRRAKDEPMKL